MTVLQVSLPSLAPGELLALGQALASLRDEGVLLIGSGFLTHNMRAWGPATPDWARDFDAWCADVLERQDVDALLGYQRRAPGVRQALPTHEHFAPVLVSVGAASDARTAVKFPITGFMDRLGGGAFTRRSIQSDH